MSLDIALKVSDKDNVATIFTKVKAGTQVEVRDKKGDGQIITVIDDIPYGHKIALDAIHAGEQIYKYGEEIGRATVEIKRGSYVHVHNMDSMRGRGDLEKIKTAGR